MCCSPECDGKKCGHYQRKLKAKRSIELSCAVIGDGAQNIFLKIGDSNAFVSQQMETLQKSDSLILKEMHNINSGLKNIIELTEHQNASSNILATKAISGLENLL
jgi:hypothetical protein